MSASDSTKYILAFDIGTTKLKAGIVETGNFKVVCKKSIDAEVNFPREGWAEVDPERLWSELTALSREVLREGGVAPSGIIFTAHMAGVLPIDKDANPLYDMIIWLDERAHGYPKEVWSGFLKIEGYNIFRLLKFLRITGGAPSKTGKDPLSKIVWLRENMPDVYNKVWKFIDVKGYLLARTTGEFVTSPDEATLTWLADTRDGRARWSEALMRDYGLSIEMFPKIFDSTSVAGRLLASAASDLGLEPGIPVFVGCGDMPSAAVGSGAVSEGRPHIYIGTSDWIAAHISKRIVDVSHYIGSILSGIPHKYLLVAEQEIASGALEWMMKVTGGLSYEDVEQYVSGAEAGSSGILFLPWMFGERCPVDNPSLRGAFLNLSIDTSLGDILRSIMEGVALNIRWAWEYFRPKVQDYEAINLVGGAALFDEWCQILADTLNVNLIRMKDPHDAGLRGIATIAAVGLGIYRSFEEAVSRYSTDKLFKPRKEYIPIYNKLYKYFREAYEKLGKKIYPIKL